MITLACHLSPNSHRIVLMSSSQTQIKIERMHDIVTAVNSLNSMKLIHIMALEKIAIGLRAFKDSLWCEIKFIFFFRPKPYFCSLFVLLFLCNNCIHVYFHFGPWQYEVLCFKQWHISWTKRSAVCRPTTRFYYLKLFKIVLDKSIQNLPAVSAIVTICCYFYGVSNSQIAL